MEQKKLTKILYEQCVNGNFQNLYSLLLEHQYCIEDCITVKFLSTCCNVCIKNPQNDFSTEYLSKSLKFFTSTIQHLQEVDLLIYLQSVYHILKSFIEKECFHLIPDLEEVLLPPFLPSKLPEKHNNIYISTGKLLHNIIAKSITSNGKRQIQLMLQISYLLAKLSAIVSKPTIIVALSYGCFVNLYNFKITTDEQEQYFLYSIKSVSNNTAHLEKLEFFAYFLNFIFITFNNIMKDNKFDRAKEFLDNIKQSVHNWNDFKEFEYIFNILEVLLVVTPLEYENKIEFIANCRKDLKQVNKLWKLSTNMEILKNKFAVLVSLLINYYKVKNSKHWCQYSDEMQIEFFQFIYDFSKLERSVKCSCKCGVTNDTFESFAFLQHIVTLLELSKHNLSLKSHKVCAKLFSNFCAMITYLQSKNCEKWKSMYDSYSNVAYQFALNLTEKSKESAIFYHTLLVRHFFKHKNVNENLPKHRLLNSVFYSICCCHSNDIKKSLAFSALAILLCPSYRDYFMSVWLKTKHSLRETEDFNKVSLVGAFTEFSEDITSLTDNKVVLTTENKISLLTFELQQYKKKWKSKIPMMTALKELSHLLETSDLVKIIAEIYGDYDLLVHEDVVVILDDVLNKYEKTMDISNVNIESKMYLAILYFLHYKYSIRDTITKNANEMESAANVINNENAVYMDPNEECDVVSSYESLKLDKYMNIIKYLNKALELFNAIIPCEDFKCNLVNLYSILMSIAFEYRLICFNIKCIQALQLALKIAQNDNNPIHMIEVVGFLIEKGDVKKSQYLVDLAEEALLKINPEEKVNVKYVITYLLFKSKLYFPHDPKESFRIFSGAVKMFNEVEAGVTAVLECQLNAMYFQYFMLPCEFKLVDHKDSAPMTIYRACTVICDEFRKNKLGDGAYYLSVVFDINEEITKYYYLMGCPREVRQYGKDILLLAQKMVLPLRCVSFLTYLAWADLYSSHYEDCQVKLNGIADILCLPRSPEELNNKQTSTRNLCCGAITELTDTIRELYLDNPETRMQKYKKIMLLLSPVVDVQKFSFPAFTKHNESCDCLHCSWFEYQTFILKKVRLDAIYYVKHRNYQLVQEIYSDAVSFYHNCVSRFKSYCDQIDFSWKNQIENEYLSIYGYILLEYSKHLMRNKKEADATNINKKVFDLIGGAKLNHIHLYQQATLQKLVYLCNPFITEQENKSNSLSVDSIEEDNVSKTPEMKHHKVMVPVDLLPYSPPELQMQIKLPRKKLIFSVSPSDKRDISPTNFERTKRVQESSTIKKDMSKTPAPKIQIYTESSAKSTNKKKKTLEHTQVALPVSVPSQNFVSAESSGDENNIRRTRTKLLTQKLKQSTKKIDNVTNNENISNVPIEPKKRTVRKTLLKDLDDKNDKGKEIPIRKSARNKT